MVDKIFSGICVTEMNGQHSVSYEEEVAGIVRHYSGRFRSSLWFLCFVSIILVLVLIHPVMGDPKYMSGSPELNAHIAGSNEFSPDDDINLQLVVENTGLNQFKMVQSQIIDSNDLSNTAKQLTVTLAGSDAPLIIKADPQVIGDLPAGTSAIATFHIKVSQDAPAGTYQIPIELNYTFLYQSYQEGTDFLSYQYKNINDTVYIPMKIKSDLKIALTRVQTENLNPGNEGYLFLTVLNTGSEDGRNAAVILQRANNSPLTPAEGSDYIGDFPPGAAADCRFRIMVSPDALQKSYPLEVLVNYKNSEGDYVNSGIETIGVPVGGKVNFNVTPISASISPGEKSVITVQYQNTGDSTAYNAQARITVVDPITSNDDTSFLGTMAPGDIRTASFDISVASDATVKEYGLDSEIIYRDSLDNQVSSDPVKVNIQVAPAPGILSLIGLPAVIALIVVLIGVTGYRIVRKRSKHQ